MAYFESWKPYEIALANLVADMNHPFSSVAHRVWREYWAEKAFCNPEVDIVEYVAHELAKDTPFVEAWKAEVVKMRLKR